MSSENISDGQLAGFAAFTGKRHPWPYLVSMARELQEARMEIESLRLQLEEALKNTTKPKCPACNSVGMSHCAYPEECGGIYYPPKYVAIMVSEAEIRGWNAAIEAAAKECKDTQERRG